MNSATIVKTYKNAAGTTTIQSEVINGNTEKNVEDEQIADGETRSYTGLNVTLTELQGFAIGCKKSPNVGGVVNEGTTQLEVKTYLATVLKDTFTITPQNGAGWSIGDPIANPLTSNFDEIKVTNDAPSGSTSPVANMDFTCRILRDS